jgi:hypothetical protein
MLALVVALSAARVRSSALEEQGYLGEKRLVSLEQHVERRAAVETKPSSTCRQTVIRGD